MVVLTSKSVGDFKNLPAIFIFKWKLLICHLVLITKEYFGQFWQNLGENGVYILRVSQHGQAATIYKLQALNIFIVVCDCRQNRTIIIPLNNT